MRMVVLGMKIRVSGAAEKGHWNVYVMHTRMVVP